jgi:hypothetical protein
MNPGDLVRIRDGRSGVGSIGVVIGPSKDPYAVMGYLDVLFSSGILLTLPSNLVRVRKTKGVINEAR